LLSSIIEFNTLTTLIAYIVTVLLITIAIVIINKTKYKTMANGNQQTLESLRDQINAGKVSEYQPIAQYYAINQTGNILVSSTVLQETELREEVVTEFQKTSVLFDAIATAIALTEKENPTYKDASGKNVKLGLFHYDYISNLMNKSKFFVLVEEEVREYQKKDTSVTLDLDMISQLVGDFALEGGVSVVMQRVLSSMGGKAGKIKLGGTKTRQQVKLGHILFVVEDIMGMPLVSIQVMSASLDDIDTVVGFGCGSYEKHDKTIDVLRETFMFIDPEWIQKFATGFVKHTRDYDILVNEIKDSIQGNNTGGTGGTGGTGETGGTGGTGGTGETGGTGGTGGTDS